MKSTDDEEIKFWSKLAKQHPVIKESFRYKEAGRDKEALEHIINYFRLRSEPVYLFSEKEVDEFYDKEILTEADAVCEGWILGHHFTGGIDWKYNATENTTRDGEWLWSLSRHQWWIVLGRAYRQTKDEKYAREAHSHRDAGHVEYIFHGEDVLIDTGRYLYGNCSQLDWWQYFASTPAHNTIGVDGFPMGHIPGQSGSNTGCSTIRNIRTLIHQNISTPAFFAADLSHNGYSFLPQPVFHRRRVVFFRTTGVLLIEDRLTGAGKHDIDLYFNFAPGNLVQDQGDKQVYHYQRGSLNDMVCRPLLAEGITSCIRQGSENPKAGWVSYAYSEKEPTPQLTYSLTSRMPCTLYTLFSSAGSADFSVKKGAETTEIDLFFRDENYRIVFMSDGLNVKKLSCKKT